GMTYRLQMNSNLVCTSSFQLEKQQGMASKALQHTKVSASLSAARNCNCHLLAVARIPAYGSINTTRIECHNPFHKSEIALDDLVPFHLLHQSCQGTCVFSDEDEPGCILVKTMNDSWSHVAFNSLQTRVVSQ